MKEVKSAGRALEVLEYFARAREPATVIEISQAFDWPQSSTSELLHFMSGRGYLVHDRQMRRFAPAAKVALLGSWVQPTFFREGRLLPMLDSIARETGELVVLATQVGLEVQYIHVVQATNNMRMHTDQGSVRPLLISAVGRLFLSTLADQRIRDIAWRLNAEAGAVGKCDVTSLMADIRDIRKTGYALSLDRVTPGGGLVSILLPDAGGEPLAIAIGGMSWLVSEKCEDFVDILRRAVAAYLAARTADAPAALLAAG